MCRSPGARMQFTKSCVGPENSADHVLLSVWVAYVGEWLACGNYEQWFRAPERPCVAGCGKEATRCRGSTQKERRGKDETSAILVVHLAPSVHVRLILFAYSGRMRTAVPDAAQKRSVKPPPGKARVSFTAGIAAPRVRTEPSVPICPTIFAPVSVYD